MGNEFIEEFVAKQRTQANLTNIQLDTQSRFTLDHGTTFGLLDTLQGIAKKSDIAKIENEKSNLLLDAKEMDLKFETDILSDPLVYSDDSKYENAVKSLEELRASKYKMIDDSRYLTAQEKKEFKKRLNLDDSRTFANMLEKRNGVVVKKQIDDILANIDRTVAMGGRLDINDIRGGELLVGDIQGLANNLKNLTGMTDSEVSLLVSGNVMKAEEEKFRNHINKIANSSLNFDQKKARIENLFLGVRDGDTLDRMARAYASQIEGNTSDEEFEKSVRYFKASIGDIYDRVGDVAYKQLEYIKTQEEVKRNRERRQQRDFERDLKRAYDNSDYNEIARLEALKRGETINTTTFLYNEIQADRNNGVDSFASFIFNKPISKINEDGEYIDGFLDKSEIKKIDDQIKHIKEVLGKDDFEAKYMALDEFTNGMSPDLKMAVANSYINRVSTLGLNEDKILVDGLVNDKNGDFEKMKDFHIIVENSGGVTQTELNVARKIVPIVELANKIKQRGVGEEVAFKTAVETYKGINNLYGIYPATALNLDNGYRPENHLVQMFAVKSGALQKKLIGRYGKEENYLDIVSKIKRPRIQLKKAQVVTHNKIRTIDEIEEE